MGRVVSDGVSDAYIQDVVVLDDWRGKGIGKAIVKKLLDFCLEHKLLWIGLVAEPGTKGLYTPLGFKTLPGEPIHDRTSSAKVAWECHTPWSKHY